MAARIDFNRGRGTWKSSGVSQVQFGPLALTRALCPPGSLHDQIVKQWGNIRSYTMKNGHLFLALMADGGIYEFEPAQPSSASFDRQHLWPFALNPDGRSITCCSSPCGRPSPALLGGFVANLGGDALGREYNSPFP